MLFFSILKIKIHIINSFYSILSMKFLQFFLQVYFLPSLHDISHHIHLKLPKQPSIFPDLLLLLGFYIIFLKSQWQFAQMEYLDRLDPDWTFAAKHGKACSPGRPIFQPKTSANIKQEKQHDQIYCQCCLNIINKEEVPLCENSKELSFLGFGFPLYFIFNKYAIILLILQIVSYSVLSLYWAVESTRDICEEGVTRELPNGQKGVCTSWLIMFIRSETVVTDEEIILRLCSFLIQLLGLVYIRDMISKTRKYYNQRSTLISHFSFMLSNLPKSIGADKRIREFMRTGLGVQFKVQDLILINELGEFFRIRDKKMELTRQKQKWLGRESSQEQEECIEALDQQIAQQEALIKQQYEKELHNIQSDQVLCEKAIVVLGSEQICRDAVQRASKLTPADWQRHFGEEAVEVTAARAPEPKEIMWQNINYPNKKRVIRLIIGWTLTAILIVVVTGVFYGILHAKGNAVDQQLLQIAANPDSPEVKTLQAQSLAATLLTMLLIIIFNKFCISYVLHLFTDLEMHRTGSEYQFSFGLKYTLGLFFTTALMTIFVEDLGFKNIYSMKYGVLEEESIMFFFNAFLIPIIWLIHPWQLYKLIKRKIYFGRKDLTQREANDLMENSKYSVGKKYAEVTESVWFAYLYASMIPGGAVLIAVGICIFYWVDKRVLLRFSSINENVNGELSIRSVKLLDATLILRAVGEIIFDSQVRNGVTWESYVCLVIAVVYILLPMDTLLALFHGEKFKFEQKLYSQAKKEFVENYYSMNPLLFRFREEMIVSMRDTIQVSKLNINSPTRMRFPSKRLVLPSIDKIAPNEQNSVDNNNSQQKIIS